MKGQVMLKENILYKEDLPVNCTVMNLDKYPIHFHNDIEMVFVLQGEVRLKNGYYNYDMKEGDIYILNDREIHSYYGNGMPNVVLILQLSLPYFSRYYEILKNNFFVTDMNGAQDESIERLQELLARIALEELCHEQGYEKRMIELAHNLIGNLIGDFQFFSMEDGKFVNESSKKGNKVQADRLNRIADYMYDNYNRRLTLTEIAEKEHLSIYYLSHFIKEASGLSFQDLLNFIRVEESEKLLLGTDRKIGAISVESGFSAVRYYIKYFIKWFGMHPVDYRNKYTNQVKGRDSAARFTPLSGREIEDLLCLYIEDIFDAAHGDRVQVVAAEFDTEEVMWKKYDLSTNYIALIGLDHMRPISELLDFIGARAEDLMAGAPGYFILESRPGYSMIFYNFSDQLLEASGKYLPQSIVEEEIEGYEKETEFFIKFIGLSGFYRIARCRFTKDALLSGYKHASCEKKPLENREKLIADWSKSPAFSVDTVTVFHGLNIQTKQSGSCVELVLIDPVTDDND